jgi:hypothetical protein
MMISADLLILIVHKTSTGAEIQMQYKKLQMQSGKTKDSNAFLRALMSIVCCGD